MIIFTVYIKNVIKYKVPSVVFLLLFFEFLVVQDPQNKVSLKTS